MKRILQFVFLLLVISCVDPYEFRIYNNDPSLVVEAYISDKSYTETLDYPSEGRYFTVKLSKTGDVINIRPEMIVGASVILTNDSDEEWVYTESINKPGTYILSADDFKAIQNTKYRLKINLADGDSYESAWEELPANEAQSIGEVSFSETEIRNGKNALNTKGITPNISIPQNSTGGPIFYQWKFTPTWIWVAPLVVGTDNPRRTCWATSPYYIRNYTLHQDFKGGYKKDLLFIPTELNERILEEFSLLVNQYSMKEEYYYFWKEMQELNQDGGIFDSPPFNLKTNFSSVDGNKNVSGYFGVVREQARRWYFNTKDLSYKIDNTLFEDCSRPCGPGCPPPNCSNCLRYEGGEAITNVKPSWWGR